MGTLILWAAICGIFLTVFSLVRSRLRQRWGVDGRSAAKHSAVIIIPSAVLSVATYVVWHYDRLNAWHDLLLAHDSLIENLLSTSHVRNALLGIVIAILAFLWLEQRRRFHEQSDADPQRLDRFPDLHLVLLTVVTLVAVLTAELPGLLSAYQVSVGPGGISLESQSDAQSKPLSSSGGSDSPVERAQLISLGLLRILTGQAMRDAGYVCALANSSSGSQSPSKCKAANTLGKYHDAASKSITPVFNCMVQITEKLKDKELSSAFVRPVATAYMRTIYAEEAGTTVDRRTEGPKDRSNLLTALRKFRAQIESYKFFRDYDLFDKSGSCSSASKLSWDADSEEAKALENLMNRHDDLPYGHIAYAIFSNFFGDPASGIVTLQRWKDRSSLPMRDNNPSQELRYWTNYIARFYQNLLISGMADSSFKVAAYGHKHGARDILLRFRSDFIGKLSDEAYCASGINQKLMEIYYLHIQENWRGIRNILENDEREIHTTFDSREIQKMKDALDEYSRFWTCFEITFNIHNLAQIYQAYIEETLGDYKLHYARYIERREVDTHPERLPDRLRVEAAKHFRSAEKLLKAYLHAAPEPTRVEESSRMEGLVALLSGEDVNRDARKLRAKLDELLKDRRR